MLIAVVVVELDVIYAHTLGVVHVNNLLIEEIPFQQ